MVFLKSTSRAKTTPFSYHLISSNQPIRHLFLHFLMTELLHLSPFFHPKPPFFGDTLQILPFVSNFSTTEQSSFHRLFSFVSCDLVIFHLSYLNHSYSFEPTSSQCGQFSLVPEEALEFREKRRTGRQFPDKSILHVALANFLNMDTHFRTPDTSLFPLIISSRK